MGRRCQPSCRAKRPLPRFPTVWPKRSPGNLAQAWGATGTGQHRRRLPLATYEAGGESLTGRQTTTARSGAPTPATARGPQSFHRQSDRRAVDHSGLWVRAGPLRRDHCRHRNRWSVVRALRQVADRVGPVDTPGQPWLWRAQDARYG